MPATAIDTATRLPLGTWVVDPTHSTATFSVKHMGISTFRGGFDHIEANLTVREDGSAQLAGTVRTDSIAVKDENLAAHLASPEFFDSERYPEISFDADSITREGDELQVSGELQVKDQRHPLRARGTITDPAETLGGAVKVGVTLEATIDRTEYGLDWNAPLPKGGLALGNDVKLTVELELVRAED
jgi:polyisoprenoid-binding protein YceI